MRAQRGIAGDQRPRAMRCCGVRIDPVRLDDAIDALIERAKRHEGTAVHLCNAYTLSLARRDSEYRDLVDRGDLNFPDGMPLVWVSRRLGFALPTDERPRGTDVFVGTVQRGREEGLRHYLYGSTPEVVERLAERLRAEAPGAEIVGAESPPFRPLDPAEKDELVDRIRATGAHVVWVGLGTPRQDVFVDEFRDRLGAVLVAVGAAFDFLAGEKSQAPAWMQRRGLEWVHRLASEPRRLWKRYLVGNTVFLYDVLRGGAAAEPR